MSRLRGNFVGGPMVPNTRVVLTSPPLQNLDVFELSFATGDSHLHTKEKGPKSAKADLKPKPTQEKSKKPEKRNTAPTPLPPSTSKADPLHKITRAMSEAPAAAPLAPRNTISTDSLQDSEQRPAIEAGEAVVPRPYWPEVNRGPNVSNAEVLAAEVAGRRAYGLEDDEEEDAVEPLDWKNEPDENLYIAKRYLKLLLSDLAIKAIGQPDLLGYIANPRVQRRHEAIRWMYDLYETSPPIPFLWVCEVIGHDPEVYRRVVARNMRADLKRILDEITGSSGFDHAKACEEFLSDYVNLSGWCDH